MWGEKSLRCWHRVSPASCTFFLSSIILHWSDAHWPKIQSEEKIQSEWNENIKLWLHGDAKPYTLSLSFYVCFSFSFFVSLYFLSYTPPSSDINQLHSKVYTQVLSRIFFKIINYRYFTVHSQKTELQDAKTETLVRHETSSKTHRTQLFPIHYNNVFWLSSVCQFLKNNVLVFFFLHRMFLLVFQY